MRAFFVRGLPAALVAGLAVATFAPVAASTLDHVKATNVRISTRMIPKLGPVLVNSKGMTLYMFVPDKRSKVTCIHTCAAVWPPLRLPSGAKAAASGLARSLLLGSDPNPTGGRVVTYNKWPLYTYIADRAPGQAKGQALNLNGGYWYVLSPAGRIIYTKLGGRYP
jgi:predicted lipoprotein with Yx(FWY)xxD motif